MAIDLEDPRSAKDASRAARMHRIRDRRKPNGNRSEAAVFCGFAGGFVAKGNQHKKENSVAFPLTGSN